MKKLILLLFLQLSFYLSGQVKTVVVQWDKNASQPCFPHALYADGENTLPYITRKFPWNADGMLPAVKLEDVLTSPLGNELISGVNTSHVTDSPLVEYSMVREAKQAFVLIKILPFIRGASGDLRRVNSMDIRLEKEKLMAPLKSEKTGEWAANSVLSSGDWFKISVTSSGIHKLTYEQLQGIGLTNPASVRVYGSGAQLLPEQFSQGYLDDLQSVPVYMHKGSDGTFGPGDFILFYAQGPYSWEYSVTDQIFIHRLHPYSWKGFYFLTDQRGAVHTPVYAALSSEAITHTVTSFDFLEYYEDETYNLISSGREWYGDNFNVNLEQNYPFFLPNRVEGENVRIRIKTLGRSNVKSTFLVSANNQQLGSIEMQKTSLSQHTSTYAYEKDKIFNYLPSGDNLVITLAYQKPDTNSEGWLDAISVNCRRKLELGSSGWIGFRDSRSAGPGNISEFRVEKPGSSMIIWEITDPSNPMNVPYTLNGSTATFRMETNGIREFIAFSPDALFTVPEYEGEGLGAITNQDLHGLQHPDMIIITPEILLEEARRLSEHRINNDGLDVAVVLQDQVFNEFSSGTPDVTAIRNFMKMFYDRSNGSSDLCRYLLLFGDGSYDNRNRTENNPNLILTYQSENSLAPTSSYVSDDYFGLLDTDETMKTGLLDIGIGRLPVSTVEEAASLVDKIISYSDRANLGEWRNQLCFIGDDEDGNLHMRQADEMATKIRNNYPAYNINKIYLDAYPQEDLATGPRYPDVTRAINDQINRGALIVNYTGHGGPDGLAHEKIVTTNDIKSWSNKDMLPLFVTATCEFSRYDEYNHKKDEEITSAGEEVLLNTEGGGIGLFTTTRLVYSGPNHELNVKFYDLVFEKDENQQNYRLGDIIAYSKNNTQSGINKRNFTLLGDPSMRLVFPEHRVVTDSINGMDINVNTDTISAFDWVTVSGHLETQDGIFMDSFNGSVYSLVFDKEKQVETLSNDDDPAWDFMARNNILYSGKSTVTGGQFSFGFFVPKDINFAYGTGKISYYSKDSILDAHGSSESFFVGGIGSENAIDDQPPGIRVFMNDTLFVSGGITDPDPILLVYVDDNFGINTTGNGIGHDLTAILDEDRINSMILNEFYQANTNSYNSGVIRYPYSNLETGRHSITVKIWDIHNNSSESVLDFVVTDSEEMLLKQLFNYPNPFVDYTWFNLEHNRPGRELRLVLTIYNLAGEMVRKFDTREFSAGYRLEPLMWDGTTSGGSALGGGVYLYRAVLTTGEGETATESGKLIITR